jgi:hypothetical protein
MTSYDSWPLFRVVILLVFLCCLPLVTGAILLARKHSDCVDCGETRLDPVHRNLAVANLVIGGAFAFLVVFVLIYYRQELFSDCDATNPCKNAPTDTIGNLNTLESDESFSQLSGGGRWGEHGYSPP